MSLSEASKKSTLHEETSNRHKTPEQMLESIGDFLTYVTEELVTESRQKSPQFLNNDFPIDGDLKVRKVAECVNTPAYPGFSAVEYVPDSARETISSARLFKKPQSSFLNEIDIVRAKSAKLITGTNSTEKVPLVSTSDWHLNEKLKKLIARKHNEEMTNPANSIQPSKSTTAQRSPELSNTQVHISGAPSASHATKKCCTDIQISKPVAEEIKPKAQYQSIDRDSLRKLVKQQRKARFELKQRQITEEAARKQKIAGNLMTTANAASIAAHSIHKHKSPLLPPHKKPTSNCQESDLLKLKDKHTTVDKLTLSKNQNVSVNSVSQAIDSRLLNRAVKIPEECCFRASKLLAEDEEIVEVNHVKKPKSKFTIHMPKKSTASEARGSARRPKTLSSTDIPRCPDPSVHLSSIVAWEDRTPNRKHNSGVNASLKSNLSCPVKTTTTTQSANHNYLSTSFPIQKTKKQSTHSNASDNQHHVIFNRTMPSTISDDLNQMQQPRTTVTSHSTSQHQQRQQKPDYRGGISLGCGCIGHQIHQQHAANCRLLAVKSWVSDAEVEKARLQARLSAVRTRRFLALETNDESTNDDAMETSDAESGAITSSDDDSDSEQDLRRPMVFEISEDMASEEANLATNPYSQLSPNKVEPVDYHKRLTISGKHHQMPHQHHHSKFNEKRQNEIKEENDPLRFMAIYRQKRGIISENPATSPRQQAKKPYTESNSIGFIGTADKMTSCHVDQTLSLSKNVFNGDHEIEAEMAEQTKLHCSQKQKKQPKQQEMSTSTQSAINTSLSSSTSSHAVNTVLSPNSRVKVIELLEDQKNSKVRITPAALSLNLTAEFNRYDVLTASEGHIQGMEALRQLSKAQSETVGLAQLLQVSYEHQINKQDNQTLELKKTKKSTKTVQENSNEKKLFKRTEKEVNKSVKNPVTVISDSFSEIGTTENLANSSTYTESKRTVINSEIISVANTELEEEDEVSIAEASAATADDVATVSLSQTGNLTYPSSRTSIIDSKTHTLDTENAPNTYKYSLTRPSDFHIFPRAGGSYTKLGNKSLNTTNELFSAIDALDDSQVNKTTIDGFKIPASPPKISKKSAKYETSTINTENFKRIIKRRAHELKIRRAKAEILLKLTKKLDAEEVQVVQLESEAYKAIKKKRSHTLTLESPFVMTPSVALTFGSQKSDMAPSLQQLRLKLPNSAQISDIRSSLRTSSTSSASVDECDANQQNVCSSASDILNLVSTMRTGTTTTVQTAHTSHPEFQLTDTVRTVASTGTLHYSTSSFVVESANPSARSIISSISAAQQSSSGSITPVNIIELNTSRTSTPHSSVFHSSSNENHHLHEYYAHSDENKNGEEADEPSTATVGGSISENISCSSYSSSMILTSSKHGRSRQRRVRAMSYASDGGCGVNTTSDLSEMTSRLAALYKDLEEKEELWLKIDKECKRVKNKDSLARLERTLLQHKNFCTEIISKIKCAVLDCHSSINSFINDEVQPAASTTTFILPYSSLHGITMVSATPGTTAISAGAEGFTTDSLDASKTKSSFNTATYPLAMLDSLVSAKNALHSSEERPGSQSNFSHAISPDVSIQEGILSSRKEIPVSSSSDLERICSRISTEDISMKSKAELDNTESFCSRLSNSQNSSCTKPLILQKTVVCKTSDDSPDLTISIGKHETISSKNKSLHLMMVDSADLNLPCNDESQISLTSNESVKSLIRASGFSICSDSTVSASPNINHQNNLLSCKGSSTKPIHSVSLQQPLIQHESIAFDLNKENLHQTSSSENITSVRSAYSHALEAQASISPDLSISSHKTQELLSNAHTPSPQSHMKKSTNGKNGNIIPAGFNILSHTNDFKVTGNPNELLMGYPHCAADKSASVLLVLSNAPASPFSVSPDSTGFKHEVIVDRLSKTPSPIPHASVATTLQWVTENTDDAVLSEMQILNSLIGSKDSIHSLEEKSTSVKSDYSYKPATSVLGSPDASLSGNKHDTVLPTTRLPIPETSIDDSLLTPKEKATFSNSHKLKSPKLISQGCVNNAKLSVESINTVIEAIEKTTNAVSATVASVSLDLCLSNHDGQLPETTTPISQTSDEIAPFSNEENKTSFASTNIFSKSPSLNVSIHTDKIHTISNSQENPTETFHLAVEKNASVASINDHASTGSSDTASKRVIDFLQTNAKDSFHTAAEKTIQTTVVHAITVPISFSQESNNRSHCIDVEVNEKSSGTAKSSPRKSSDSVAEITENILPTFSNESSTRASVFPDFSVSSYKNNINLSEKQLPILELDKHNSLESKNTDEKPTLILHKNHIYLEKTDEVECEQSKSSQQINNKYAPVLSENIVKSLLHSQLSECQDAIHISDKILSSHHSSAKTKYSVSTKESDQETSIDELSYNYSGSFSESISTPIVPKINLKDIDDTAGVVNLVVKNDMLVLSGRSSAGVASLPHDSEQLSMDPFSRSSSTTPTKISEVALELEPSLASSGDHLRHSSGNRLEKSATLKTESFQKSPECQNVTKPLLSDQEQNIEEAAAFSSRPLEIDHLIVTKISNAKVSDKAMESQLIKLHEGKKTFSIVTEGSDCDQSFQDHPVLTITDEASIKIINETVREEEKSIFYAEASHASAKTVPLGNLQSSLPRATGSSRSGEPHKTKRGLHYNQTTKSNRSKLSKEILATVEDNIGNKQPSESCLVVENSLDKGYILDEVASTLFQDLFSNALNVVLKSNKLKSRTESKPLSEIGNLNGINTTPTPDNSTDLKVLKLDDPLFKIANLEDEKEAKKETGGKSANIPIEDNLSPSSTPSSSSSPTSSLTEDASTEEPTAHSTVGISRESLQGLVANTPCRTQALVQKAMGHFWNLRTLAGVGKFERALKETNAPIDFSEEIVEDEDHELSLTPNMSFVNRAVLFDCIRELLLRIYMGEDEEIKLVDKPSISSSQFRLWKGTTRPNTLEQLMTIVSQELPSDIRYRSDQPLNPVNFHLSAQIRRLPKLSQWTLSRKSLLDRLLEMEMRSDEASWLNYMPYEEEIKQNLCDQIFAQMLEDSVKTVLSLIPVAKSLPTLSKMSSPPPLESVSQHVRNPSSISEYYCYD